MRTSNPILRLALSVGTTRLGILLTFVGLFVALELGHRRWVLSIGRVQ